MPTKELKVNRQTKPHIHTIMVMKDRALGVSDETHMTMRVTNEFSVENATNELTKQFAFTEYSKSYAFYKDGATEYMRFKGSVSGLDLELTIDVFSCYCEPLNENQEPPF